MKIHLISFLCCIALVSKAQTQNLVPDSSFEDIEYEAVFFWNQFDMLSNQWFSPTRATPDLFTTELSWENEPKKRNKSYANGLYAPKTFPGFQYPKSGGVFAGFIAGESASIYREYIAVKLVKPLEKGKCYSFRMFLNLPDLSNYYGVDVGCKFLAEEDINANKIKHNKNPIIYPTTISIIDTFKLEPDIIFNLENLRIP